MKAAVDKYTILKWLLSEDDDTVWVKLQMIREEYEMNTSSSPESCPTTRRQENVLENVLTDEMLPYTRVKNHVTRWSY